MKLQLSANKNRLLRLSTAAVAIAAMSSAQAALTVPAGNSLVVYDSDLNVYWTQNANLFYTQANSYSGGAAAFVTAVINASGGIINDTPNALDTVPNTGVYTLSTNDFYTSTGQMDYWGAKAWVAYLNHISYAGLTNWTLPQITPVNGSSFNPNVSYNGTTDRGFNSTLVNATASPLAYLYFNELGDLSEFNSSGIKQAVYGLTNSNPFSNFSSNPYWFSQEYDGGTITQTPGNYEYAWLFTTATGAQGFGPKDTLYYAEAVAAVPQGELVTASITTTWYEPMTQPCNSIFVGSFTYNTTTHAVTHLKGVLSEAMTGGAIGYDPATGPNGTDDMSWLSLNYQLSNGDATHTYTWHDSTNGGTFATVFLNDSSLTFATNYNGNTSDGWSPASSMNVGRKYCGYPNPNNNPMNAYALIFVPDGFTTNSTTSLTWNESTDMGSLGLADTAYADYTGNGMMGSMGMTGTSAYIYGKDGTMDGVPSSEVIAVITPPNLLIAFTNGVLQLNWPTNFTGAWRLEAQTNTTAAGLGANWTEVPGSAGTNQVSLPVDSANPAVFFRLVYP